MIRPLLITLFLALLAAAVLLPAAQAGARPLYYAEEFYLYVMNLYQENPSLTRNIRFMQWALKAPFTNQVNSLATITNVAEFRRYKSIFRMHVNLLIIDSYLQLARRFDKEHVYFFHAYWYAEELKESFTIARYLYEICYNYWDEAVKHAREADQEPARLDREDWEEELYLIRSGELDYRAIVDKHLERLDERMQIVEQYLETEGPPAETDVD
jgi:hypothetical protein